MRFSNDVKTRPRELSVVKRIIDAYLPVRRTEANIFPVSEKWKQFYTGTQYWCVLAQLKHLLLIYSMSYSRADLKSEGSFSEELLAFNEVMRQCLLNVTSNVKTIER